jgi:hypothetical protein
MISSPLYVPTYPSFTDGWGEDKLWHGYSQSPSPSPSPPEAAAGERTIPGQRGSPPQGPTRVPALAHSRPFVALRSPWRRSVVTGPRQRRSQAAALSTTTMSLHATATVQADGHQRRVHSTAATRSPSSRSPPNQPRPSPPPVKPHLHSRCLHVSQATPTTLKNSCHLDLGRGLGVCCRVRFRSCGCRLVWVCALLSSSHGHVM